MSGESNKIVHFLKMKRFQISVFLGFKGKHETQKSFALFSWVLNNGGVNRSYRSDQDFRSHRLSKGAH